MTSNKDNYDYSSLSQPLEDLIDKISDLHDIIQVTIRGLGMTQGLPNAVTVLAQYKESLNSEEHKKELQETERIALIAKNEIESEFPFLYTQAAIMLYCYLEGAIKHLVILFFQKNDLVKIREVANLKIAFSEFILLNDLEKYDYLFSLYEKSITSGIQYGMTRFESLLSPIGLSGNIKSSLSKIIFELAQIRNNILHRSGVADKQLITNCPWLGYSIGDKITVNKASYESFHSAICRVVVALTVRIGERMGKNMDNYRESE